ncbi:DUF4124 domain-containing protein, partial [Thiolapillus sp.]|uniref:DUF4124 domain-containing protein n=1 Tax=Thiolapillus sp. TaxID=2017437 RepID=UPI003AF4BDFA
MLLNRYHRQQLPLKREKQCQGKPFFQVYCWAFFWSHHRPSPAWTDDEGDVVYSQTPPPDNRPVKPIAPPPPPAENTSQIQQQTQKLQEQLDNIARERQACLRPRDRFWDIPVPKIDSAFDNLLVPQPSWSPSTTQQL